MVEATDTHSNMAACRENHLWPYHLLLQSVHFHDPCLRHRLATFKVALRLIELKQLSCYSIIAGEVESKKSFIDELHELTRSGTLSEGKRFVKKHGLKALV